MTSSPILSSRPRYRIAPLFCSIVWITQLSACHDNAPADLQPWLAQAYRQARPLPLPAMAIPVMPPRWQADAGAADPFGLQLAMSPSHSPASGGETAPPVAPPAATSMPPLRAVAILRRQGASRALLQIGSRMLQVAPGDTLPGMSARVLDIDERAVRLELAGREVRLELGMGGSATAAAPSGAPA